MSTFPSLSTTGLFAKEVYPYATLASFPATGVTGRLYIAQDTNQIYHWNSTTAAYAVTSSIIGDADATTKGKLQLAGALGGTAAAPTVFGLADTAAYTAAMALKANASAVSNVDNTSDANKPVSTAAQTALDLKAPLASPELTGVPTVPTAAVDTNTTQAASTAFVIGQAYAKLASPALTGTPTAPTAAPGTNTTQVSTTAFVQAAVAALVDASPGTLDTLNELAAALADDPNFATTMTTALALKAPLASPTLTGVPASPTAAPGTNTTQIATTAFVAALGATKADTSGVAELAQDAVAAMIAAGTHSGISFDYNDAGNALSATVVPTAASNPFDILTSRYGFFTPVADVGSTWNVIGWGTLSPFDSSTASAPTLNDDALGRMKSVVYTGTNAVSRGAGVQSNSTAHTLDVSSTGTEQFPMAWIMAITDATPEAGRAAVGWIAASVAGDPSALLNSLGFGFDEADTNWQIMHNDGAGTATKVDLGASFARAGSTRVPYLFVIDRPVAGVSTYTMWAKNLSTGATSAVYTASTDLPDLDRTVSGVYRWSNAVGGFAATIQVVGGVRGKNSPSPAVVPVSFQVACSDRTTNLTTGTNVASFRAPHAFTLTAVRSSLDTASSSGLVTVDVNEDGVSVLSTKLSIDASEKTSTTAATAAVISDATIADDAELKFDIDAAGTGAKGLMVTLIGTKL